MKPLASFLLIGLLIFASGLLIVAPSIPTVKAQSQINYANFLVGNEIYVNQGIYFTFYAQCKGSCHGFTHFYYSYSTAPDVWVSVQIPDNSMPDCGPIPDLNYGVATGQIGFPGFFVTNGFAYMAVVNSNSSSSENRYVCYTSGAISGTTINWSGTDVVNTALTATNVGNDGPVAIGVAANGDVWVSKQIDSPTIQSWILKNGVFSSNGGTACGNTYSGQNWTWVNLNNGGDMGLFLQEKFVSYCTLISGTWHNSTITFPGSTDCPIHCTLTVDGASQIALSGSNIYVVQAGKIMDSVTPADDIEGCLLFSGNADTSSPVLNFLSAPITTTSTPPYGAPSGCGLSITSSLITAVFMTSSSYPLGKIYTMSSADGGNSFSTPSLFITNRNLATFPTSLLEGAPSIGNHFMFIWDELTSSSTSNPPCPASGSQPVCILASPGFFNPTVLIQLTKVVACTFYELQCWLYPMFFFGVYMVMVLGLGWWGDVSTSDYTGLMLEALAIGSLVAVIMGMINIMFPLVFTVIQIIRSLRF